MTTPIGASMCFTCLALAATYCSYVCSMYILSKS